MPPGDEYKRSAVECFRLAASLADPEQRVVMLDMAQAWARLADQAVKNSLYFVDEAPRLLPEAEE
jgi:hypothetical protein